RLSWSSEHSLSAELLGELVGGDHHHGADDPLDDAGGRGQPPLAARYPSEVDEGVQHLGGVRPDRRLLQQHLLETDGEEVAEVQDEQQCRDRHQGGERHVPRPPPSTGSVRGSRLVEFTGDPRDGREEDDGPPSHVLRRRRATTRILKVSELPMALKPSTPTLLSRVATSPSPPTTCAQMEITITQDRKWGRYTTVCTKRRVASESRL